MSKDNRTLPGGFQRPTHLAREGSASGDSSSRIPHGDAPGSTPPPDSAKAFDPYRFGAYTVPPSLRMELINIEVPDTPEDQLFHPPPIEEPKATALVVEPASSTATRDVPPPVAPGRSVFSRVRFEVVIGVLAVTAGLCAVLLQRSCAKHPADVASVSAARTSVVSTAQPKSVPSERIKPLTPLATPTPQTAGATLPAASANEIEPGTPVAHPSKRVQAATPSAPLTTAPSLEQVPTATPVPSAESPSSAPSPKSQSVFDTKMRPPID